MPSGNRTASLSRLEEELHGPVPGDIARLTGAELEHLAAAVATARRRQAAELAAAGERGLSFVPRLLRGPLRKVLA